MRAIRVNGRVVYNVTVAAALAAITAGAWLTWGLGTALLTGGGIMILLTVYANERVN